MSLLKDKIELEIQEAEFKIQQNFGRMSPLFKTLTAVLLICAIPSYFAVKGLSAKYWQAKYRSLQTTAKPSFTNPKDPKIEGPFLTSIGEGIYSAVFILNNENLELSLNNTPYRIQFYNEQGENIYAESNKLFLLPNQKKYLVVPRIVTSEKIVSADLQFSQPLHWQKRLHVPDIKLITSVPEFYHQFNPVAFVVEGNVENSSPFELKQIRLTFLVYNNERKLIAASQRDEFAVKPFEKRSYKQLWPNVFSENAAYVQVFGETNSLDPANVQTPSIEKNSSSDLDRPSADLYR